MTIRKVLPNVRNQPIENLSIAYKNKSAVGLERAFGQISNNVFFVSNLPEQLTAAVESVVNFGVEIEIFKSTAQLTYQWQTSADGLNWISVGSNSKLYSRTIQPTDDGLKIRVLVTQLLRTVFSNICTITTQIVNPVAPSVFAPDYSKIGAKYLNCMFSDDLYFSSNKYEQQSAGNIKIGQASSNLMLSDSLTSGRNAASIKIGSLCLSLLNYNSIDLIFSSRSEVFFYNNIENSFNLSAISEPGNLVLNNTYSTNTSLPSGLTLSSSGILSGSCSVYSNQTINLIVQATDNSTNVTSIKSFVLKLYDFSPPNGLSAQTSATSAQEILRFYPDSSDGAYYINNELIYCLMSVGGWMLSLKTFSNNAQGSTTFSYSSNYWTTSNTLNTSDATTSNADAKFSIFNTFRAKEALAVWPDINASGGGSLGISQGWTWQVPMPDMTCLQFFQTRQSIGNPFNFTGYRSSIWGSQSCFQEYGVNLNYNRVRVRWGFVFNNECDANTPDVVGGIGIDSSIGFGNLSSGDRSPSGIIGSRGIDRGTRVLLYVR